MPPVCVISMPNSSRRKPCVESWKLHFANVTVFEAVVGKDVSLTDPRLSVDLTNRIGSMNTLSRFSLEDNGDYIRSKPAIGCALSHIAMWNIVLETQTPMIVVEDDTTLSRTVDTHRVVQAIMNEGLVFLITSVVGRWLVRDTPGFWGMNAYYITPDVAETLLKYAFPLNMHIDRFIHMLARRLRADWCILTPPLPHAIVGKSTLEHSFGRIVRTVLAIILVTTVLVLAVAYNRCRTKCDRCNVEALRLT